MQLLSELRAEVESMTVSELIEAATSCDVAEVVVRENGFGRWLQGYRIGKEIERYPAFQSLESIEKIRLGQMSYCQQEKRTIKPGAEVDGYHGCKLPMKLIRKDVNKLPEGVKNLTVSYFQPRHIPSFHRDQMTHNEFQLDICCYPEGWEPEEVIEDTNESELEKMQLSIDDWLKGGEDDD